MAAQPPILHFLPWVRQGAAADIRNPDSLRADQDAVVKLPVDLWINRNGGTPDVSVTAQLYGPADVTGIDPQQVVRTEPRPMTSNFEPNLFPAIEFDRPDFPWLFTPLSEGVNDQLRPWLVLVVVKKQDGVTLNSQPSTPLPVLAIKTPARPARNCPICVKPMPGRMPRSSSMGRRMWPRPCTAGPNARCRGCCVRGAWSRTPPISPVWCQHLQWAATPGWDCHNQQAGPTSDNAETGPGLDPHRHCRDAAGLLFLGIFHGAGGGF